MGMDELYLLSIIILSKKNPNPLKKSNFFIVETRGGGRGGGWTKRPVGERKAITGLRPLITAPDEKWPFCRYWKNSQSRVEGIFFLTFE
jgi:hypothetical protein